MNKIYIKIPIIESLLYEQISSLYKKMLPVLAGR